MIGKPRLQTGRISDTAATSVFRTRLSIRKSGGLEVVQARAAGMNLAAWLTTERAEVESSLLQHGCLLFRGFEVNGEHAFEAAVAAFSDRPMAYRERTSPRKRIRENIYTSTEYPAYLPIFPHNESSYSVLCPGRLFFYCTDPASRGGETAITSTQAVTRVIPEGVKQQFRRRGYLYVRNFFRGSTPSWQDVFQASTRTEVEVYCRSAEIEFKWLPDDGLRTWQVRPAFVRHPVTGDELWFNHAAFFHVTTLPSALRAPIEASFNEVDLPHNTYYGDGTPIEAEALDSIRSAYREHATNITWERGDIAVLDNFLMAHGREPFEGPRRILVALANPHRRKGIDAEPI